jgi:urocanate hydratase
LLIIPVLQITVLNAGRKYLGTEDLAGKVFVSSGLGGMSGAQPKAAVIAGCIAVIAEVTLNTCSFTFSLSVSY